MQNQTSYYYDPAGVTRISRPVTNALPQTRSRGKGCCGCLVALIPVLLIVVAYFLFPIHSNLLVLGIDRAPGETAAGRSDTMILVYVNPLIPTVRMLSIPRDLWVPIANVGENRINTAHFFAEAEKPGSGPEAALRVVKDNFNVPVGYYVRVRFDGFQAIIDAMGGLTVDLPYEMAGLPAGAQHLDGAQALAVARDRKGADDFFRMQHGQLIIKAAITQMFSPATWVRLPAILAALPEAVDTNIPFFEWPRLGFAFLRASIIGIDSRTLDREMVTPFITSGGADVLLPNWDQINPVVKEMFGL